MEDYGVDEAWAFLPADGVFSVAHQIVVGQREVVVAEESAVGGEWRGMGRLEYQMLLAVNHLSFALGIAAPEQKHQMFSLFGQPPDGGIGELFPSPVLVRTGLMGPHRQRGVEQQYALFGPAAQAAAFRNGPAQIALDLLEDVLQ